MTSKKTILILIALFCLLIPNEGQAQRRDTLQLRVMTYNLRFGELASLEDIAAHIRSFKPDFVALEEVDVKTYREPLPTTLVCLDYTARPSTIARATTA